MNTLIISNTVMKGVNFKFVHCLLPIAFPLRFFPKSHLPKFLYTIFDPFFGIDRL